MSNPRQPAHKITTYKVRLPLTGVLEIEVEADSTKDAKAQSLAAARAFVDSLEGDDSLVAEWRAGVPNRRDIAIEETPRLCGGPLEVIAGRRSLRCGRCGAEAPPRHRGAQCNRPVRARK
jgi:hypothetical protein